MDVVGGRRKADRNMLTGVKHLSCVADTHGMQNSSYHLILVQFDIVEIADPVLELEKLRLGKFRDIKQTTQSHTAAIATW